MVRTGTVIREHKSTVDLPTTSMHTASRARRFCPVGTTAKLGATEKNAHKQNQRQRFDQTAIATSVDANNTYTIATGNRPN